MNKIILCGLGPHAMKYHYRILEEIHKEYQIEIELLIDMLPRKNEIEKYLHERAIRPKFCLYLEPSKNNILGISLDKITLEHLQHALRNGAQKLLISTEPKSHKQYALWGLANNLDVLVDKPLTAPSFLKPNADETDLLVRDFNELKHAEENSKGKLYVFLPKRRRKEYCYLKSQIDSFVAKWHVPLTHTGIHIREGMWNMPDEFFTRENHPYKYGYGGLLHSGYHYTDMLLWFLESNNVNDQFCADRYRISIHTTTPYDFAHQINSSFYKNIFSKTYDQFCESDIEMLRRMGELDVFLTLQAMHGDICINTTVMNILHTSYSGRAWTELPPNTYEDNGRIHHENIELQFGTLMSIQTSSRSLQVREAEMHSEPLQYQDEYIIETYKNTGVLGGKEYERKIYSKENEKTTSYRSRQEELVQWIRREDNECELSHHRVNILLIKSLYDNIFARMRGEKAAIEEVLLS